MEPQLFQVALLYSLFWVALASVGHDERTKQCQELHGPESYSCSDLVYAQNRYSNSSGHCGYVYDVYFSCYGDYNIYCGALHCHVAGDKNTIINHMSKTKKKYAKVLESYEVSPVEKNCYIMNFKNSFSGLKPGLVTANTPCAQGLTCNDDRRCERKVEPPTTTTQVPVTTKPVNITIPPTSAATKPSGVKTTKPADLSVNTEKPITTITTKVPESIATKSKKEEKKKNPLFIPLLAVIGILAALVIIVSIYFVVLSSRSPSIVRKRRVNRYEM